MKLKWYDESVIYHIFPMGACGASKRNDYTSPPEEKLSILKNLIPHLKKLNINTVFLGPVFESESHGYDTVDYFHIDRRLGRDETLKTLVKILHDNDIRVVIDGVFNHVSRDFFAFRDLCMNREDSQFLRWFHNIDFNSRNPYNDPFSYEGWNGHLNLVKLNLEHEDVKNHLLSAVHKWIVEFDIDGLRLDAADCLSFEFMKTLRKFTSSLKKDFWLMGEVIHGDYSLWANEETLHSVTNYEGYKSLWSSHNDENYFEIAYSLNRLFNPETGILKNINPYSFADNHDVTRVYSILKNKHHVFPLHLLLFTMPGIPSIYYGSEWKFRGEKNNMSDENLRPELEVLKSFDRDNDLEHVIMKLSRIRNMLTPLKTGNYKQLMVNHRQFSFCRETDEEGVIVVVNSESQEVHVEFDMDIRTENLFDVLNNEKIKSYGNRLKLIIPGNWGRIIHYKK